ncbi:hypothetical protein BGZ61DRAFT_159564 [Ilyonectria robusta]|uniref:uncharacterized protein n=1 Tax=Ilyonectria robusta TaxID=1079257 RepID=UPI001E8DE3BD|nr:uncharacterized protein BGZ61DRAFT_159564 [Ilyonectria robusta]KAH8733430.1 hypothetical protein BGZ61DRAFT_159564 [Ilyonectria robusta]
MHPWTLTSPVDTIRALPLAALSCRLKNQLSSLSRPGQSLCVLGVPGSLEREETTLTHACQQRQTTHPRCLIRPRLNQITVFAFVHAFMIQPSNPLELAHPIAERSPGTALSWQARVLNHGCSPLPLFRLGIGGDWGENGGTPWVVIHDESGARSSASTSVSGAYVVFLVVSYCLVPLVSPRTQKAWMAPASGSSSPGIHAR